jgi:uncharacterized protein
MKLHLTQAEGNNLITAYENGAVLVNHQRYTQSLIVMPQAIYPDWQVENFDALNMNHFAKLAEIAPEVVILGTGNTHRFIHPRVIIALTQKNIPVECMTTDAACRTYNILMSEGRIVAAALLL